MMEQVFFFLSLPFLLRFRSLDFSFAQWMGFLQDLFIVSELLLFLSFSSILTAGLGFLFHLYLLLDAFLFTKMHLRMRFGYLRHLRHPMSLWHSAKELSLLPFFWIGLVILTVHGGFFLSFRGSFGIPHSIFFASAAVFAFLGSTRLAKTSAFRSNNPVFQEHLDFFSRFFKKDSFQKDSIPFFRPASFSGPKIFEISVSDRPHLIFLFLESFSAKNINSNATPCFNRLAAEGIFFTQFYANGTLTYRALLAGLFGTPPGSTAAGLRPYVDLPLIGLPELLKQKGYRSAFHHNGSLSYDRQREFLEKHFEEIQDRGDIEKRQSFGWGIDDESLIRHSANWLEEQKMPIFLTLFTISNHHPWILPSNTPSHYCNPSFGFASRNPKERFLRTTHYTDFCLGLFVDLLREKNLSQKTILFVLGDHGQPMGEHQGNIYNSRFLYEENVRVPFLILADGRIASPKTIDTAASQIDLLPTAMDFFNLSGTIFSSGASLMRTCPEERTLFFQNPYSEGFLGCRKGPWKWIENILSAEGELYDLHRDPQETRNLADIHRSRAESLRLETRRFFASLDAFYEKNLSSESNSNLELDFSDQLIADEELIEKVTPSVQRIRLENCLLLTDCGVASLFKKCPFLEAVNLKGIDLADGMFENGVSQNLQILDISEARQISDRGLTILAKCCPYLTELAVNGRNLTDRAFVALGPHITRLKLFEGIQITDEGFVKFLQNNKNLNRLAIYGCQQLTDRILIALKEHPVEQLWLFNAPLITDKGIADLVHTSIRSLVLTGCRQLTEKCIPNLQKLKLESIYIKDCPALDHIIENFQAGLRL